MTFWTCDFHLFFSKPFKGNKKTRRFCSAPRGTPFWRRRFGRSFGSWRLHRPSPNVTSHGKKNIKSIVTPKANHTETNHIEVNSPSHTELSELQYPFLYIRCYSEFNQTISWSQHLLIFLKLRHLQPSFACGAFAHRFPHVVRLEKFSPRLTECWISRHDVDENIRKRIHTVL